MKLSAIVAMSTNRVIGKKNRLPWQIPEDLKRFRSITMGHSMIMGRKTFESIGKILPGRESLILTRQPGYLVSGAHVFGDLAESIRFCEGRGETEVFVVGGAEIYALAMPRVDRLYLTLVHQEVDGDTFFPEISWPDFKTVSREDCEGPVPFSFIVLDRDRLIAS